MRGRPTPVVVLLVYLAVAGLLATATLILAVHQPWLGLTLRVDDQAGLRIAAVAPDGPSAAIKANSRLVAIGDTAGTLLSLEPSDLVDEPDEAATYAQMDRFLARQGQFAALLRGPGLQLVLADGQRVTVTPAASRPIASLPPMFWILLLVGLLGAVIGGWTLGLRPADASARLFAASTGALLLSFFPATIYMHRELALPEAMFRLLSSVNIMGSMAFAVGLLALFLIYPRRLMGPALPTLVAAGLFGLWLADALRLGLFEGPGGGRYLTTSIVALAALTAAVAQYRMSHGNPLMRAAILWLALSIAVGTAVYIIAFTVPTLLGAGASVPSSAGYLLAIPIFAGIAIGIARYRLFELEIWAFRIFFYLVGVAALMLLDLLLVLALTLDQVQALGLSLGVVALFYLPLRGALARRLLPGERTRGEHFQSVVDAALAPTPAERNARWQSVLREVFDPLNVEVTGNRQQRVELAEEGLTLLVPGHVELAPSRLSYAGHGRRLFSPRDVELVEQLLALLRHSIDSRAAYERGTMAERMRIARDMHDNIGARLLSALHSTDADRKDAMVREALLDFRNIINNLGGAEQSLEAVLADLRLQTADRLAAAGLTLRWMASEDGHQSPISAEAAHTLRSTLRESVSNAIRHAGARQVSVEVMRRGDTLTLGITDDGKGLPADATGGGIGLVSMRNRIAALGGTLELESAFPGLRVAAVFPCVAGATQ